MKLAVGIAVRVSVTNELVVGLVVGVGLKPLQDARIAIIRNNGMKAFSIDFTFAYL